MQYRPPLSTSLICSETLNPSDPAGFGHIIHVLSIPKWGFIPSKNKNQNKTNKNKTKQKQKKKHHHQQPISYLWLCLLWPCRIWSSETPPGPHPCHHLYLKKLPERQKGREICLNLLHFKNGTGSWLDVTMHPYIHASILPTSLGAHVLSLPSKGKNLFRSLKEKIWVKKLLFAIVSKNLHSKWNLIP